jgi:hypothetical protein
MTCDGNEYMVRHRAIRLGPVIYQSISTAVTSAAYFVLIQTDSSQDLLDPVFHESHIASWNHDMSLHN